MNLPATAALDAAQGPLEVAQGPVLAPKRETTTLAPPLTGDENVRRHVRGLLTSMYPSPKGSERRQEQRFPLPRLVYLSALDIDGITPLGEPLVVVGKDISERGLGFFHQQALPDRRMIASFETTPGNWLGFVVDLKWCRFTTHGWYVSGGRLLEVVASPLKLG